MSKELEAEDEGVPPPEWVKVFVFYSRALLSRENRLFHETISGITVDPIYEAISLVEPLLQDYYCYLSYGGLDHKRLTTRKELAERCNSISRLINYRREVSKTSAHNLPLLFVESLEDEGPAWAVPIDYIVDGNRAITELNELCLQYLQVHEDQSLDILIDPGDATPEDLGDVLAEISVLYRMLGGSGITFTPSEIRESEVA